MSMRRNTDFLQKAHYLYKKWDFLRYESYNNRQETHKKAGDESVRPPSSLLQSAFILIWLKRQLALATFLCSTYLRHKRL